MGRRSYPKTDFGTVLLHWTLVALLAISVVTGLRIAIVSPSGGEWLQAFDGLLPHSFVWTAHMASAVSLFGLAVAYVVYVRRAGLVRRILPDRIRLMGISRRGPPRWSAINILLTCLLLVTLLALLATGFLMYLGHGGIVVEIHRLCTWTLVVGAFSHVGTHWAIGGWGQATRIFRPSRLVPPAPPFDPFELLAGRERPEGGRIPLEQRHERRLDPHKVRRPTRRDVTLQAHPFVVAIGAGLVGVTMITITDQMAMRDELHIRKINTSETPVLDGDLSDPIWRSARPVVVRTNQGANFDGTWASEVEIRAVHDGEIAYFSFVWSDPTRSLKHLPLVKKDDGWHVLQTHYDIGDENEYHEDKFSIMLTNNDALFAGDRTFHPGRAPLDGKPATLSGRGLHYTADGSVVDVWQWMATRSGHSAFVDDGYFGPPAEPSAEQVAKRSPYKGGFAADPGTAPFADNFEQRDHAGFAGPVQPKRLPKDWRSTWSAMGQVDLRSNVGESDGAQWWMSDEDSLPYSPELDTRYPINAVIPGVIISGEYIGDRADVRCAARWAAGRWAIEIARRLDTNSHYDVRISSGIFMRVAAFDHSQIRHTRHIRPIRLEVE